MFSHTSIRLAGLIAVVCAVVVAPQALAASTIIAPPDADQRYEPGSFSLSGLPDRQSPMGQPANNTPGGIVPAYVANTSLSGNSEVLADDASTSGTTAMFVYMPTNPGWGAAATEAKKSASKPALAPVLKTAPVVCLGHAEYDYVDLGCEWWS